MTTSNPQTSMDETDLTSEHESITAAASEWQTENHKLRRLAKTVLVTLDAFDRQSFYEELDSYVAHPNTNPLVKRLWSELHSG